MGGYEVTADSEQPMMFRVCLSAVKTDQRVPQKSHMVAYPRKLMLSAEILLEFK